MTPLLFSCTAAWAQLPDHLRCPALCAKALQLIAIRNMAPTRRPEAYDLTSEQEGETQASSDWSKVEAAIDEVEGKDKPTRFRPSHRRSPEASASERKSRSKSQDKVRAKKLKDKGARPKSKPRPREKANPPPESDESIDMDTEPESPKLRLKPREYFEAKVAFLEDMIAKEKKTIRDADNDKEVEYAQRRMRECSADRSALLVQIDEIDADTKLKGAGQAEEGWRQKLQGQGAILQGQEPDLTRGDGRGGQAAEEQEALRAQAVPGVRGPDEVEGEEVFQDCAEAADGHGGALPLPFQQVFGRPGSQHGHQLPIDVVHLEMEGDHMDASNPQGNSRRVRIESQMETQPSMADGSVGQADRVHVGPPRLLAANHEQLQAPLPDGRGGANRGRVRGGGG